MAAPYYRARKYGPKPRTSDVIDARTWGAIVEAVRANQNDCSFADRFPVHCYDKKGTIATDQEAFMLALRGAIPEIDTLDPSTVPETEIALEVLEFCHDHVSLATHGTRHDFLQHTDWQRFDQTRGQQAWRTAINAILERNGIAFALDDSGRAERVPEPVATSTLIRTEFATGDADLDTLLAEARQAFVSPESGNYGAASEKLWDAWERLKTLDDADKKKSIGMLVAASSVEEEMRKIVDAEMRAMTDIGNKFRIRHHETDRFPIESEDHFRWLFMRAYATIYFLLRRTGRLR